MAEHEQTYWWHLGRLKIINTYVTSATGKNKSPKLLNVGCGTGGTIAVLETFGRVDNVDISDDAIRYMKNNGYKRLTKVEGIKLPFKAGSYNIIGAFDVLEHIDDQIGALKEWRRVLKQGGSAVITVPAYQWLWSEHDVSLHHKRRYTTKSLAAAAEGSGLVVEKVSYAIAFSLPLVVGFRYINKLTGKKHDSETSYVNVPSWMNKLFTWILGIEAKLHKYISLPFGTSVVAILRKES